MFGRRAAPMGASFKEPKARRQTSADRDAAPFLRTFDRQIEDYIDRAKAYQAQGVPARASFWAAQARRAVDNRDRMLEVLSL